MDSTKDMGAAAGSAEALVAGFGFANTYARLPERFFARQNPTPVANPRLIELNLPLALKLGLDPEVLAGPEGVAVLAGNRVAKGSEPLAIAYAGHQFGNFVPQLGDGRANLLGEIAGFDVQLKGSGPTPFSRRGDGRAAMGPVLREYLVSEAMAALGVPTTRALAAVATGEQVVREEYVPGAVLTRIAASHLRVGTFQYFAARGDTDGVRTLANYAIARHYPEAAGATEPYLELLQGVIARQARLVAQWMTLGFVHGVMNTDNTSISGETIDYGPCAFLEAYDEAMVFSSIDRQGRYAYGNQPGIMLWNLTRLAECLLPLLGEKEAALEAARSALGRFAEEYEAAWQAGFARKLGLMTPRDGDRALIDDLLALLQAGRVDFTLAFRRLSDSRGARDLFADRVAFEAWESRWRDRLTLEGAGAEERMRKVNPAYIPRNHQVEAALRAALDREDFAPFRRLLAAVTEPFAEREEREEYAVPARPEECVTATFCGT